MKILGLLLFVTNLIAAMASVYFAQYWLLPVNAIGAFFAYKLMEDK